MLLSWDSLWDCPSLLVHCTLTLKTMYEVRIQHCLTAVQGTGRVKRSSPSLEHLMVRAIRGMSLALKSLLMTHSALLLYPHLPVALRTRQRIFIFWSPKIRHGQSSWTFFSGSLRGCQSYVGSHPRRRTPKPSFFSYDNIFTETCLEEEKRIDFPRGQK